MIVDLFCGRGGWARAAMELGHDVVGYDTVDHGFPGQLILKKLPIPDAEILAHQPEMIVASPPCEDYARAELPWLRTVKNPDIWLLAWSISLQARMPCPVVIECSKFAGRYIRPDRFLHPYALWGQLPLLLPQPTHQKTRLSGRDPAARAMVDHELAIWIISHTTLRERSFRPVP